MTPTPITGSVNEKGMFTEKNPYDRTGPQSTVETESEFEIRFNKHLLFEQAHPQLLTYTASNVLVTDEEHVEVVGPVWQYREGKPYPFVNSPNNINEKQKGYESRRVYITIPPTELPLNPHIQQTTTKMKIFNNEAIEALRKGNKLSFAKIITCPHTNNKVIQHAGVCQHNMDDDKDSQDVELFKELTHER